MADRRRTVFMGTPDFAVPSLALLAEHHDVIAVYAQPPRRQGRGMKLRPSPVHAKADDLGLPVHTPLRFEAEDIATLSALAPEFLVVVAYGMILPQAVLDIPSVMPINGHASLLPRWRGAAPIHRAIASGDTITGITTMKMEAGLDTGPMLQIMETPIHDDDDTGTLHDRLAEMTAEILLETINAINTITPIPQDHDKAIYAEKITPDEAEINFSQPLSVIEARLRAFRPFPGSWLALGLDDDGKPVRLKVKDIHLDPSAKGKAGEVLGKGAHGGPMIAAADGGVELISVQPQGKPAMSGLDFLNGNTLPSRIIKAGAL